ncbi:hypothetical protein RV04_GL000297 [Enterococcus hermanniensis]|uniref:ABC transporter permease n=1 Tax=Enterococcus hermanniensis TaxID=249189 RepID=A0A1L8TRY6_9ENTE|nr:hypothetical protein RV04_GL000297 [Enterococcus hermanniensis]
MIWIVVLVGLFASAAIKFNVLFGTQSDITAIVQTLKLPAMVSLFGEFTATKPYTTANVFASEMLVFIGMFMVFMNISLAITNTRAAEDSGLLEMVRARSVGRLALLYATTIEIILINVVMAGMYIGSLFIAQLNGANDEGNFLMGISIASMGILFGFLSLLMGQLMNDTRSAYFTSYGLYAVLYICRMLTDVSDPKWTWVSPVGWVEKTEIYSQNNWLPVVLMLGLGVGCLLVATRVASNRDIGSGVFSSKEGKATAGSLLSSPIGLVLRLERNSMIGWVFGSLVLGAAYGSIFQTIGDIIGTNPTYKKLLGVSQVHAANRALLLNYLNMLGLFFVVLAVVSGILVVFRLESDEHKGYLEMIHAKKVTKTNLVLSYFLVGVGLSLLVFTSALVSTFFIGNSTLQAPLSSNYFWQTSMGFLPAILFFMGCATALVGIVPKASKLLWGYLAVGVLVKMFGPLMNLPDKYAAISPFGWVGKVPSEAINQQVTILLGLAFIILTILGFVGYNKRDME